MRTMIGKCPACDSREFEISRLRCTKCETSIEGRFKISKLGRLSTEHQNFIEIFIKCRGNIKDVERELGISYPTVRSKLDRVIQALGYSVEGAVKRRREVLLALEKKEMTPEEAVNALKDIS